MIMLWGRLIGSQLNIHFPENRVNISVAEIFPDRVTPTAELGHFFGWSIDARP